MPSANLFGMQGVISLSEYVLLFVSIAGCAIADSHLAEPGIDGSLVKDDNRIRGRDPVADCIRGRYQSSCWNTLGLTQWLSEWNTTTELCTTSKTNSCRAVDELWTDTFLRIAMDEPRGSSCVNLNACPIRAVPDLKYIRPDVSEVDRVRYQYVLYNIHVRRLSQAAAINSFFSDWYRGMYNAAFEAQGEIMNIVQTIDPPNKNSGVLLHDILSALTAGLAFLAMPEGAALTSAAATTAPIFLKAIQQAPRVAKIIWPSGTVEREIIEIGALGSQLAKVTAALSDRISQALASVMGRGEPDLSTFLAFAQDGEFSRSADQFPDIANKTRGLLVGFTTFLVSEALVLAGWHAVVSLGTDPLGLTNGSAMCPGWINIEGGGRSDEPRACPQFSNFNYGDMQCSAYDAHGQCEKSYWWYSNRTGAAFSLAKTPYYGVWSKASKEEKDPTAILQTIFANGWSTGQLLLENAGRCVVERAVYEYYEPKGQLFQEFGGYNPSHPTFESFKSILRQSRFDFLRVAYWRLFAPPSQLMLQAPNGTNYTIDADGFNDFNCTSQLNLTIYTDWPSVWYLHKKF
ncbi:MAG: hypothetical protein Q9185_004491 [Variospora sp. 1 TL-2023]